MSEFADDIEAFAKSLTESEEYDKRFEELIQQGFDENLGPSEHLDFVIETLFTEFVDENDNIQNDVPGAGDLFEATFKKETAQRFAKEMEQRQDFLDHIESLADKLESGEDF